VTRSQLTNISFWSFNDRIFGLLNFVNKHKKATLKIGVAHGDGTQIERRNVEHSKTERCREYRLLYEHLVVGKNGLQRNIGDLKF
jgi:hypothetical protein